MSIIYQSSPVSPEGTLAYNLWQLEEERISRERRMAIRASRFLKPIKPGWWKKPVYWGVFFSCVFMARDAFATLLVELIVQAGL